MGDTLVLHSLIATPSFHKHTNTWHGGVVFQRSYHQAVWELGHLKEERKNVTQNTQLSHRNKTSGTLQLKMTPAIRKILQKLTKHSRSVFSEENIMTTSCELDFHCVLFDSRAAPTWASWGGRGAPLDGFRPERGSARLPLLLAAA